MKKLTPRQNDVLVFITAYTDKTGLSPTQREIAEALGVTASWVGQLLFELRRKGFIRITSQRTRNIQIVKEK